MKKLGCFLACLWFVAEVAVSPAHAVGTICYPRQITYTNDAFLEVLPAAPSSDKDVQLTVAAKDFSIYADAPVVLVSGNRVDVTVKLDPFGGVPPPPQCATRNIGRLAEGTYTVNLYTLLFGDAPALKLSKSFTVSPASTFPIAELIPPSPNAFDVIRLRLMIDQFPFTITHVVTDGSVAVTLKSDTPPISEPLFWYSHEIGILPVGSYDVTVQLAGNPPMRHLPLVVAPEPRPQMVRAVEFYHAGFDHYFMTADEREIADLDSGLHPGWKRTGYSFGVGTSRRVASAAVCRFYIPPKLGDSHFFSASADECDTVLFKARLADHALYSPNYKDYVFESGNAFYVEVPNAQGQCATGMLPVYRLWNKRTDSNHRYTTDLGLRASMIGAGYVSEGTSPLGVTMCVWP